MARRRGYGSYGYYRAFYPPSRPRQAKGGIKAQSKRGDFGQSWWAHRWTGVLESFHIGARLARGRSYARSGQVLSIDIAHGQVKAKVQGSRATPYQVTIRLETFSAGQWKTLVEQLSRQAIFTAKLLAGEMPRDIEQAFKKSGLALFPIRLNDLRTNCSCPDWSNPCKHIAAVYYLLGEEFDRDPFLLFKLRGMDRDRLMKMLNQAGTKRAKRSPSSENQAATLADSPTQPEPMPLEHAAFWQGRPIPDDLCGEVRSGPVPAALPRRLGSFPFWRGERPLWDFLDEVYSQAAEQGLKAYIDLSLPSDDEKE